VTKVRALKAKDLPHIFDRFYRSTKCVKQTKARGWDFTWREQSSKRTGTHLADPEA